jgi:hypothetical protein
MMSSTVSDAIAKLSSTDVGARAAAASELFRRGRESAERAMVVWWQDSELSALLLGPAPIVTVGMAVQPATFARIRVANGAPRLTNVPPDQDAEEFELHFGEGAKRASLDVLTTRDPNGQGAIARFLGRFGEGLQQVEFCCLNVDRATAILRERFAVGAIYPQARPGADGTKINFFLVANPGEHASGSKKILIELYEKPSPS